MNKKILFFAVTILALFVTVSATLAQDPEAPVITSTPITTVVIGQQYSYQVTNTPADNGELFYELTTRPQGMTINSAGLITWTPTSLGAFNVVVVVGDEDSQDEQSFTIIVTSIPAQFSANDVILGSPSQKRGENIEGQVWTVTNTGSEAITNIVLTLSGIDSKYQVTTNLTQTTLNGGESMDVLFNAYVPDDQDAGRIRIGTAQLTGNGVSTLTKPILIEAENNLIIDRITVNVGGRKETLRSPGTIDKEAKLGDDIQITVRLKNTHSNLRMENINIELDSLDLDVADGLDQSIRRINKGDTEEVTFRFTLDIEDVDPADAPFTITINVDGEDENGATHGESWDIRLDMDTLSRDVRLVSYTATPSILSCNDRSVRLDYRLRNVGTRDTSNAMVEFKISEIGFGELVRNLEIDEGYSEDFTTTLNFGQTLKDGTYLLEMTIYATTSSSDKTDSEVIPLEVRCGTSKGDTTNNQTTDSNIEMTPTAPVQVTGVPVASSTGTSSSIFKNADKYLIALGLLVLVLLVVVIALAARLIGRN